MSLTPCNSCDPKRLPNRLQQHSSRSDHRLQPFRISHRTSTAALTAAVEAATAMVERIRWSVVVVIVAAAIVLIGVAGASDWRAPPPNGVDDDSDADDDGGNAGGDIAPMTGISFDCIFLLE